MNVNDVSVDIDDTKTATRPGWCALNSAHTIAPGQIVGRLVAAGKSLGWVCTPCLRRAQPCLRRAQP